MKMLRTSKPILLCTTCSTPTRHTYTRCERITVSDKCSPFVNLPQYQCGECDVVRIWGYETIN